MKITITHTFDVNKIEDIIKHESQDSGEIYRKFTDYVYTIRNMIHDDRRFYTVKGYKLPNFSPQLEYLKDIPERLNWFDFFALTNTLDTKFDDL